MQDKDAGFLMVRYLSLLMAAVSMNAVSNWYYLPLKNGSEGAGLAIAISDNSRDVVAGLIFQPARKCSPTLSIRLIDPKIGDPGLISNLDLEISYQVDERSQWTASKQKIISEKTPGALNNYIATTYDFVDELLTGATLTTELKYPGGSSRYLFNLHGSTDKIMTAHSQCTRHLPKQKTGTDLT